MIIYPSKLIFILILILGTLLTISSNTWIRAWMGLEINLLSFIPLINDNNNIISNEACIKYFLIQAIASSTLLFSSIILIIKFNFLNYFNEINFSSYIIIFSLLIKIGAAPFHFWFPRIIDGLNWFNRFILLTWQKIAPIIIISLLIINKIIIIRIIFSSIVSIIGIFNQFSLRKIIAYSSINHLRWIIIAIIISKNLWFIYFFIYSIISILIIFIFNIIKIFYLNQLFFNLKSNIIKLTIIINLLSLGGLPPFLGFLPKFLVIQFITFYNIYFLTILIIICRLIILYIYIKICYSSFLINSYENNWIINYKLKNKNYNIFIYSIIFSYLILFIIFPIININI